MEWIAHALHWAVDHLKDPANAAITLLSALASPVVAGAVRGYFAAKADTARMLAAGKQPPMNEDERPMGQHRLPSPFETDTALERHYRDGLLRCEQDRETANEARRLAEAQTRALLAKSQEQEAEIMRLRGELEARTYALANAQSQALALRKEVSALRGGGDGSRPAPRTPGSQRGLEPVTDPPPRPLDELRDTPPSGLQRVRAPRS